MVKLREDLPFSTDIPAFDTSEPNHANVFNQRCNQLNSNDAYLKGEQDKVKQQIQAGLPANGGNADTVDDCHAGTAAGNVLKLNAAAKVPESVLRQAIKKWWQPSTTYTVGDTVTPLEFTKQFIFVCVVAGMSSAVAPTWEAVDEKEIQDGTVKWKAIDLRDAQTLDGYRAGTGAANLLVLDAAGRVPLGNLSFIQNTKIIETFLIAAAKKWWKPSTNYEIGNVIEPLGALHGQVYECVQSGSTGTSEPAWPTANYSEFNDGTVRWQVRDIKSSGGAMATWKRNTSVTVGVIAYSPNAPSYVRIECVIPGMTGTTEPVWPEVGQMIVDGSAKWIVDDIRDGAMPGDICPPSMIVRPGRLKLVGQLVNRIDVPRLVKLATDNNLFVSEENWAGGMKGLFGMGDGATTMRMPDLRGDYTRALDDGLGVDQTNITGNTTSGNATISNILIPGGFTTAVLAVGMSVTGTGIPSGATIASIVNDTSITITANATATAAGVTLTITGRKLGSAEAGSIESHYHAGTRLGGNDGHTANTYMKAHASGDSTTGSTGGPETRGRNIAYYATMKY